MISVTDIEAFSLKWYVGIEQNIVPPLVDDIAIASFDGLGGDILAI